MPDNLSGCFVVQFDGLFFFFFSVSLLCLTPLKSELRKKSGVVVACHHLVCTMLFKIVYIQTALLEEA